MVPHHPSATIQQERVIEVGCTCGQRVGGKRHYAAKLLRSGSPHYTRTKCPSCAWWVSSTPHILFVWRCFCHYLTNKCVHKAAILPRVQWSGNFTSTQCFCRRILHGTAFYPNVTTLRSGLCCRNSVCLSSVVCLSVTLVHPIQGVEAFGKISSPLCTLAILWPPCKILRR